jgi:phosphate acyltransferase
MKEHDINFSGNVEGNNLFDGSVDVIVCDGFTGNVIIKTAESQMKALEVFMREEIHRSTVAKIGAWLLKPVLKNLKKKADYEEYGGAPLLGIKGVCIISHGRSSPKAIGNAIRVAVDFVGRKVNDYIEQEIKNNPVLEKGSESNGE